MRLQVKGKNVEVSDAIRDYAEEKLGKLERQLADPTRVELELAVEQNPSIADNHVAEATIWTKGPTLRAREASHRHERRRSTSSSTSSSARSSATARSAARAARARQRRAAPSRCASARPRRTSP